MNAYFYLSLLLVAQGICIPAHAMRRSLQSTRQFFVASQMLSQVRWNHRYHSLLYSAVNNDNPPHGIDQCYYVDKVKELVRQGEDINQRDEHGRTPLQLASALVAPWIMEELLIQGAGHHPNTDPQKLTPMHLLGTGNPNADFHRAIACIKLLKHAGGDIEARDVYNQTPLFIVSSLSAAALLREGANLYTTSSKGVFIWKYKGNIEYVKTNDVHLRGSSFAAMPLDYKADPVKKKIKKLRLTWRTGGALFVTGLILEHHPAFTGDWGWLVALGGIGIGALGLGIRAVMTDPHRPEKIIPFSPCLGAIAQGDSEKLRVLLSHHRQLKSEVKPEINPLDGWPLVLEAYREDLSEKKRMELEALCQDESRRHFNSLVFNPAVK